MTRYTVVWVEGAERELANLWLDATDRRAVTDAADEIDRALARDATTKGLDLREGLPR